MASLLPLVEYPEAQQDQVNVLESIYGENFRRVQGHTTAWQIRHNLAFELRVDALHDKDLSVLLHIDLPPEWPKIAPSVSLKEADDVKPHVRDRIRRLLKTVKPDVDIYAVCESLQEVLEDAAESKVRHHTIPTLDEERARRATDALRKTEEETQRRAKEEQERQAQSSAKMAEQVAVLQLRQQRAAENAESGEEEVLRQLNHPNPVVKFDEIMSIVDENGKETSFRDVWGTYVLLETKEKKVTSVTPLIANNVTARRLLLKQIHLDAGIVPHPDQLMKEILKIENLLRTLKANSQESVVDIFGYKIVTNQDADSNITSVDLTILSDFANKGSLGETLDICDVLAGSRVISWTTQLLSALAFLDELSYTHPAVHLNNILLFRADDGRITVQLSDGYGTDLRKLVMKARSASGIKEPSIPAGWRAPELNKSQPTRSEKTCIWDLGVVIMQMISGKEVLNNYTSPDDYLKTNNDLADDLYDMLKCMCALDQSARPKAYDLTSFAFLRGDGTLSISRNRTGPSVPYNPGTHGSAANSASTWRSQWDIVESLGKGGFGEVFKARNRNDTNFYAVKKVKCESDEDISELFREIKLLSGLNSPRVVRYHNSWVEAENIRQTESESSTDFPSHSIPNIPSTGHNWVDDSDYLSAPERSRIQFTESFDLSEDNRPGFFRAPGEIESDSDEGVDASPQRQHTPRPTGPQSIFIVMELCSKKTLRTIITDKKLTTEAEVWRIFGQIVEGLAYIHGKGLIHRDLKPDNIFLDERNDIRIGDFGLATRGKISVVAGRPLMTQATEESRSIGTALYVAPELKSDGDGGYTNKVDMYSLGILFLEMCVPFTTTQGRYKMLFRARDLRELPGFLSQKGWEQQRQLIFHLLNHKQDERPSATDIIASGVVPQPVGSEKIHQYVMGIMRGNPEGYGEIVEHFFKTKATPAQDMAWDTNTNATEKPHEDTISIMVDQKLQATFQRHGAVDGSRQTVFPVSQLYPKPATFLDVSGITLQLPYDLTLPFARLLARIRVGPLRHYSFGMVYRTGIPGGQPPSRSEVSFDVVSYSAKDLSIKDAEVLKVLDEILSDFPSLKKSKSIVIFLNHSDLLEMIFESCLIEPYHWDMLKQLLSSINTMAGSWKRIETELRGPQMNIAQTSIAQLAKFNFQDDLQGARKKLERMFASGTDTAKLQQVFARLLELQHYASKFGVETRILMNPLVNYFGSLYQGSTMFQCVDTVQKKMIAVGGRYDHLIQTFGAGTLSHGVARAVGVRFNPTELADRLAAELKPGSKPTRNTLKTQRCDVLITSFDEQTLQSQCLDLAAELWANDIRAELTEHYNTFEELATAYKFERQCTVILVRQDSNAVAGVGIRARTIGKQDEEEIKRNEVVAWIKDKDVAEAEQSRSKLRRETSIGETGLQTSSEARQAEVIVISTKHKAKKTNRQNLVDDASIAARQTAREYVGEAPIIAVEVSKEVLEGFRSTRIDSSDTWKVFLQSCPAEETRYLKDVQAKLGELADAGKKGAWVFSSKTRACIYYDLGASL